MLKVTVGEVVFERRTRSGFLIGPEGFRGWEGAPATRREQAAIPFGHGDRETEATKTPRLVTLSGHALAASPLELAYMGDVLAGIAPDPDTLITVQTEAGARWGRCTVEGEVIFDRRGGQSAAPYQLKLLMQDPRKYGRLHTTLGVPANTPRSMVNAGNFPAAPRFIVRGPQPAGWSITATGKPSFQVDVPLAAGSTDVADFATGRVFRNGALLKGAASFPRTWAVPGGQTQTWQFAGTGSGTVDAELTDTFI